jgi:xanthine dehydrogenase YagT iron-sulfur-binding subunit
MTHIDGDSGPSGVSRRAFLGRTAAASAGLAVVGGATPVEAQPGAQEAGVPPSGGGRDGTVPVILHVNGTAHRLDLDPRTTLLDALHDRIGLTGTRKGCDRGQCGACTLHIDGRRELSCLTLAAAASGRSVTTVEGLADGDRLHPVQQAFIDCDAFQCGYCTSGQIMSAVALLENEAPPSGDEDIRERMSGNICRCGAYPHIVEAIGQAARTEGR